MVQLCLWSMNPAVAFRGVSEAARCVVLTSGTLAPMDTFASEVRRTVKQISGFLLTCLWQTFCLTHGHQCIQGERSTMLFHDQQYGILLTKLWQTYYLTSVLGGCMACVWEAQDSHRQLVCGPVRLAWGVCDPCGARRPVVDTPERCSRWVQPLHCP